MQLTEHFTLEEYTASNTAAACGIDNSAPPEVIDELTGLSETMEDVRLLLRNSPIIITSGYRCPALNTQCGGAANSAHLYGDACDFVAPDFGTPYEICQRLERFIEALGIDQLIYECGVDGEGDEWVHLAVSAPGVEPRGQMLTITRAGTFEGLVATA
jgi:hypothetical protein